MDSEFRSQELADELAEASQELDQEAGSLAQLPSADQAKEQWQDVVDKLSKFLSDLPEYLSGFFSEYKRPITTIALIAGAIVSVKLILAVLGALDDIPLVAPTLQLIGLGYTAWFVYRYLWKASSRQELSNDFNTLKEQVLGHNPFK